MCQYPVCQGKDKKIQYPVCQGGKDKEIQMKNNFKMDAKLKLLFAILITLLTTLYFHPEGRANNSEEMSMSSEGYLPPGGFVPDEGKYFPIQK